MEAPPGPWRPLDGLNRRPVLLQLLRLLLLLLGVLRSGVAKGVGRAKSVETAAGRRAPSESVKAPGEGVWLPLRRRRLLLLLRLLLNLLQT